MDEAQRVVDAVARLTPEQQRLVGACLEAVVRGPYVDHDGEFHTIMGVDREEAAEVAAAWPYPAPNGLSFHTVNNALNNLLGYPHGMWPRLRGDIQGNEDDLNAALMIWRDEDDGESHPNGYFDALM